MKIRRAGPFASFSDSFADEPSSASSSYVPVNCAADLSSASWPWKRLDVEQIIDDSGTTTTRTYETGLPSSSVSNIQGTNPVNPRIAISSHWKYQASQSFDLSFTYSASSDDTGSCSASVTVDGVEVFSDSDDPSISGSTTVTLAASVVPMAVRVNVIITGSRDSTISASYSVTFP